MKNTTVATIDSNLQLVDLNKADRFRTRQSRVLERRHGLQNRATTIDGGKQWRR